MQVKIKEGERTLNAFFDEKSILKEIEKFRNCWKKNFFVRRGQMPEKRCLLSREEYEDAYDEMLTFASDFSEEHLWQIITKWPKRKDGSFNCQYTKILFECKAAEYTSEWGNAWVYEQLKVSAQNAKTLVVTLCQTIDVQN